MTGGLDTNMKTMEDIWILDVSEMEWAKVRAETLRTFSNAYYVGIHVSYNIWQSKKQSTYINKDSRHCNGVIL